MSRDLAITGRFQTENVIYCERIQAFGFTSRSEDDADGPNILSCEKCEAKYSLSLKNPLDASFEVSWDQWVTELRAAVTDEHDISHPTMVFSHDGEILKIGSRKKRFGHWILS